MKQVHLLYKWRIVEYLWNDEKKHFAESLYDRKHIFPQVLQLLFSICYDHIRRSTWDETLDEYLHEADEFIIECLIENSRILDEKEHHNTNYKFLQILLEELKEIQKYSKKYNTI